MGLTYNYAPIEAAVAEQQAQQRRQAIDATSDSMAKVKAFADADAKARKCDQIDRLIETHRKVS